MKTMGIMLLICFSLGASTYADAQKSNTVESVLKSQNGTSGSARKVNTKTFKSGAARPEGKLIAPPGAVPGGPQPPSSPDR
jgi:hypothetical protein